jgi:hypothetical protein
MACRLDDDIPGKRLEPDPIGLHNGYGHVTGLARLDVLHRPRFPFMRPADNVAPVAILETRAGIFLHLHPFLI